MGHAFALRYCGFSGLSSAVRTLSRLLSTRSSTVVWSVSTLPWSAGWSRWCARLEFFFGASADG